MNITFRPTDYSSDLDCETIASWQNKPILQKLWVPQRTAGEVPKVTAEKVRAGGKGTGPFARTVDELAILNGRIIGQYTLIVNPPHRRLKVDKVAWPSVVIGEDSLRGKGLIRRFGARIFEAAREIGASHIEVGVFEYNAPMRRLLERAGFREFDKVEGITHFEGRAWADIRYELDLRGDNLRV